MAKATRSQIIIGVIAALLALVALGIAVYHIKPHCMDKTSTTKDTECSQTMIDICPGALNLSTKTSSRENSLICPWKKATYIIGIISLALTICLMIIFAFALLGKTVKIPMLLLGVVVIPLLLVGCALMIKDIVDGFKFVSKLTGSYSLKPGTYIVNAILMLVSIGMSAWAIKTSFTLSAQNNSNNSGNVVVKVDSAASAASHQQIYTDNSHSVPKTNWQDQSAMNVTYGNHQMNTYGNQQTNTYGNQHTNTNGNHQTNRNNRLY